MTTTLSRFVYLYIALLAATDAITAQRVAAPTLKKIVTFSQEHQSTLMIFQTLATQTHTVMAVSGTWIGSDDKLITVNKQDTPLGEVLDDICHLDPRFSWTQASDGSIQIHLGKEHLGLLDVVVNSLDGKAITPETLASDVLMMPEVRSWSAHNNCTVGKVIVIVGGGDKKTFDNPISIRGNAQPLWKVLDQIAEKANSYFWYVVKISNEPCWINLSP